MKDLFISTTESLRLNQEGKWITGDDCDPDFARLQTENSDRLMMKFQEGEIEFDWNGHHRNRKTTPKFYPDCTTDYEFTKDFGKESSVYIELRYHTIDVCPGQKERAELLKHLLDNPGETVAKLNDICVRCTCFECSQCCELTFDGKTIRVLEACPHPKGSPEWSVEIQCDSGTLVFANGFGKMKEHNIQLEGAYGTKAEMEYFAEEGIAYGFCGNCCPGIYQDGNKIIIGNPQKGENFPKGTKVGGVCTDLWAWTAADLEMMVDRGESIDGDYTTAKVKPGTYRFTQYYHQHGYDSPIYATLEPVE